MTILGDVCYAQSCQNEHSCSVMDQVREALVNAVGESVNVMKQGRSFTEVYSTNCHNAWPYMVI
jgi:hypothetical protein